MAKFSFLNKIEGKALRDFKRILDKKLSGEVVSIKLFGSKARGDYDKDSDIDILVVLKHATEKNKDKVFDVVLEILHKYELYVSVHIYSLKEFNYLNSIPTVFMQQIARDAIAL